MCFLQWLTGLLQPSDGCKPGVGAASVRGDKCGYTPANAPADAEAF